MQKEGNTKENRQQSLNDFFFQISLSSSTYVLWENYDRSIKKPNDTFLLEYGPRVTNKNSILQSLQAMKRKACGMWFRVTN